MTDLAAVVPGRLLVIEPSSDYGLRVRRHVADALLLATGERAASLQLQGVLHVDCADTDAAVRAVERRVAEDARPLDGITCFICEQLEATARLAGRLGLPFHDPATVNRSRQKHLAMALWKERGVPTPAGRVVEDLAQVLDFAAVVPPPWILKPTDGSGSAWVLRVDTASDLPVAYGRILAGLSSQHAAGRQAPPACLIQKYVAGREISADLFIEQGQIMDIFRWTEKDLLRTPGQAGLVSAYHPALLSLSEQVVLRQTWQAAIAALGVDRGIVMADAILSDGVAYALEVGLRPGGDCLPDLCRTTTGYDPIRAACQVALGLRPDGPSRDPASIAAVHLMSDVSGTVIHLDWSAVVDHPDVVQIEPYCQPGDLLRVWPGSYDDRIIGSCLVRYEKQRLPDLVQALHRLMAIELDSSAERGSTTEAA